MTVRHDLQAQAFIYSMPGQEEAYAKYDIEQGIIDCYSTFVPPQLRGQKIAEKLVDALVEYAEENQLSHRPSCSYVQVRLKRLDKL